MTQRHVHEEKPPRSTDVSNRTERRPDSHLWMMIACCAPMLVIVLVLVLAGFASPVFLIVALVFAVTMAVIMRRTHSAKPPQ